MLDFGSFQGMGDVWRDQGLGATKSIGDGGEKDEGAGSRAEKTKRRRLGRRRTDKGAKHFNLSGGTRQFYLCGGARQLH